MGGDPSRDHNMTCWINGNLGVLPTIIPIGSRGLHHRREADSYEWLLASSPLTRLVAPAGVFCEFEGSVEPPLIIAGVVGQASGGFVRERVGGNKVSPSDLCRI